MLELKNINKLYKSKKSNDTKALENVSLSFSNHGLSFILGKSGCGKSTLLNILGGLDTPTTGEIIFKGKSFKDFKGKDYDSYRNTSVGFIFQEYNLIEKYNVYDNIAYVLKLQNKMDEEKILDALDKVGLKDLAKRKVNELSGGQKQRVAIARALVKNPSIILADEPTGNLDTESSKIIFDLLKKLSLERLVIVVSHDEESANLYADRIIRLQDGVVISDSNNQEVSEREEYISQKNHLPLKEAIKISFKNLFRHKFKLILSIILIAFALSFFGFSIMQNYLKVNSEQKRLIKDFDIQTINIIKLDKADSYSPVKGYWLGYSENLQMSEDDYSSLINTNKIPLHKIYYFNSYGDSIPGLYRVLNEEERKENNLSYYLSHYSHAYNFEELDDEEFDFKLIGNKPNSYEEIVIIKPLADFIIAYGINEYSEDEEIIYKPSSYDEIINDKKYLKFGNGKVIISGIIDDNLEEFNELKKISNDAARLSKDESIRKLVYKYDKLYPTSIYVLKGFKDNFELNTVSKINASIDGNHFELAAFESSDIYTNSGLIKLDNINNNEIIVNFDYLDSISNNDFSKKMNEYIINGKDTDPSKTSEEYREEFITNYLNENKIIGNGLTYEIYSVNDEEKEYSSKIVGITGSDYLYLKKEQVETFFGPKYNFSVYAKTDEIKDLDNFLEVYPIDGKEYISNTSFSDRIANHAFTMKVLAKYIFVISLVFSLFAILLLFNFIGLSITDNKKEIGILRSLGTTKKDVTKIYSIQGLLIGFVSYIISLIMLVIYAYGENNVMFNSKDTLSIERINLVGLTYQSLLIMLIFLIIIVLISSISVSSKISKMKPIDAINNK